MIGSRIRAQADAFGPMPAASVARCIVGAEIQLCPDTIWSFRPWRAGAARRSLPEINSQPRQGTGIAGG
ncbi:hypothetical protein [Sagittula salina]|uniref:Uncharacterized protein n=1 Tax=Sagittula salina TaxID=2820268 RepID=A0A940S2T8_9RHOB|nr:hypothetical protein [Sagittula salina]MBP0484416.1 hypothetical protein [Sagittula salina]